MLDSSRKFLIDSARKEEEGQRKSASDDGDKLWGETNDKVPNREEKRREWEVENGSKQTMRPIAWVTVKL